ncbi:MAG: sigma-70 family RNA polymerase sigma factor [Phycisphaerae bacterium]
MLNSQSTTESGSPTVPDRCFADLARRAAGGDDSAFAEVRERYEAGLRALFLRRAARAEDAADELLQRTWIAVWRALRDGRYDPGRAAISTFIYAVAHRTWLHYRRQMRRETPEPLRSNVAESLTADSAAHPADALPLADLIQAMRACLQGHGSENQLTDEERWVVTQAAGGASERAMARQLGVVASTIHERKRQAYTKLRRCLEAKGFGGDAVERLIAADQ